MDQAEVQDSEIQVLGLSQNVTSVKEENELFLAKIEPETHENSAKALNEKTVVTQIVTADSSNRAEISGESLAESELDVHKAEQDEPAQKIKYESLNDISKQQILPETESHISQNSELLSKIEAWQVNDVPDDDMIEDDLVDDFKLPELNWDSLEAKLKESALEESIKLVSTTCVHTLFPDLNPWKNKHLD